MKGIITYESGRELITQVMKIQKANAGIINQITHLYYPDDNEVFDYVFEYLNNEIDKVIKQWNKIKKEVNNANKKRTQ